MGDDVNASPARRFIDLRSDTVTKPTPEMFAAAAAAEVDDDVQGFDPTTRALEEHVAALFGKEAALFMSTGTQANLCALMAHCPERGSEIIVGHKAHIYIYEQGGSAAIAGIHPRSVRTQDDGTLDIAEVMATVRAHNNEHFPITKLVCIENTQNACGGRVLPLEYIDALAEAVHARGLKLHVDGARCMNACAALNLSPSVLFRGCDSISLCLSKALGAPAGSMLIGSADFIKRASRARKVLGGAMRQNGVIAAMGMYGLTKFSGENLRKDHANLKRLAEGLAKFPGVAHIDAARCESNIVYFDLAAPHDGASVKAALKEHDILISAKPGASNIRFVTHHQVSAADVERVLSVLSGVLGKA